MKMVFLRCFLFACITISCPTSAKADVLYTTGFESAQNFTVGDDKIVGFNSWLGTTSAGTSRSGIDAETTHGVVGLGNAGWMGGNTTQVIWAGNSTNVRRPLVTASPYYYAPVTSGKDVVFISALIGIKDSSGTAPLKRDDFELFIMNGASTATGSGDVLAAIQFDNTTVTADGNPQQLVRRTQSTSGTKTLTYVSTGGYFLYDTMQLLTVRINYRTNLWTATLDGIPLFNDIAFYVGSGTLNLGAVGFRMNFGSAVFHSPNYTCIGGSNYMLFDDLIVQANAPDAMAFSTMAKSSASTFALTWNTEAAYKYQVYGTTNLSAWTLLTPTALTASQTSSLSFSDATVTGVGQKFYKVSRTYP